MADGKVTVELSVQDAQALAAWQRGREGIGGMEKELDAAKRTVAALGKAAADASKKQADGWKQLSAQGKKLYDNQTAWSRGMKVLEDQRATAAKEAADAQLAAQKKIEAEEKKVAKAAEKARREHERAAKSANTMGNYLKGQLAQWASYTTAVGLATKAVTALAEANKKVRGEEADVTFTLDTHFRQLQVQGQMDDSQAASARKAVFDIAERQAASPESVAQIAKQLISSGFDTQAVLAGGAAEELVKGMQASAMKGEEQANPQAFTEAITQFLLAQTGKEKGDKLSATEQAQALSLENLSRAVRQTQGLYLRRNIQFADLSELANAAPVLSNAGMTMTEQLAAFTAVRDTKNADEAATGLRNVVSRMQTAGASKEKTQVLASIGLTPEDIDLAGESFDEALSRLRDALSNAAPEQQAIVLKKLFEEKGQEVAAVLLSDVEKLAKYRGEATDTSAFDRSLEIATGGFAAGKRREETQKQRQRFGGQGARDVLVGEAIEAEFSEAGRAVQGSITRDIYDLMRGFGVSEEIATGLTAAFMSNAGAADHEGHLTRVGKRVEQAQRGASEANWKSPQPQKTPGSQQPQPVDEAALEASRRRREQYAARATAMRKADADEAAAKEAAKAARERKAVQARIDKEQHKADSAGKAAQTLEKQAAADAKQAAELERQIQAKRRVNAASSRSEKVANPWTSGKPKRTRAARGKSEATLLREHEALRRLEQRLADTQQKQREHEAAAQQKRDEQKALLQQQNDILAEIARNTRPGAFTPSRGARQRPPPTMGGN